MNYTLEVNSSLNREILASALEPSAGYFTLGGSLSNENAIYTFRVVIANDVGTIATRDRQFCMFIYCFGCTLDLYNYFVSHADTTDVQGAMATLIEGVNASTIQCEFIAGSTATGCMVVLTGFVAYNVNITKNPNANSTTLNVTLEHPPSCYIGVKAFDIYAGGSVGSQAVPGWIKTESGTTCATIQTSTCKIDM